ncbi:HelD family protein [Selenihalanaerobacter shriftii]|uniref:Part of AAA domain-containing protein n=1 Tax=Selenihalanaerobacter shriftii TaxID=142842 RepID=A0A1T4NXA6_9FIRM|nr:UvrD-helicase domain-containing protein [Selenihalanaerobacter shriftii]SJZ84000.1 Part of AAA domain-containing protein [Selenihalanaerobacter shriftii]
MSNKDHPDYQEEVERLEYTKDYIKKILNSTEEYKEEYNQGIREAMEELDFLDSSQSYIRILINSKFIDQADETFNNLSKVKDKPYFARIDFRRDGNQDSQKYYIGKISLYEVEKQFPLIIDWRSPLASIYYEGRLGEVSYDTEVGTEHGEILLKRQFTIEDGKLKDILDIDITTNDAFLQASLDVNADNKLKDIASTIQAEQNKVIRAEIDKPLIVQGVAGSGKTTIALHRIAYLIYTYEENFDPDNFMILTPNKLFIDYISDVLPELGVENVRQATFIDFMDEIIEEEYALIDSDEKMINLIEGESISGAEKELITWSSSFKGSLEFKDIIDKYIDDIGKRYLPRKDFKLGNFLLFSYGELNDIFLNQLKHLPFEKRIEKIKNSLSNRLNHRKDKILREIEDEYNTKIRINYSKEESEEKRAILKSLVNEKEEKLDEINKLSKTLVKDYLAEFTKSSLFEHYKNVLRQKIS